MRLEQVLYDAGQRRVTADQERHAASLELRNAVKAADRLGWTKARIARVAGISRQTVHEILRD
jgi:hypothetical protein